MADVDRIALARSLAVSQSDQISISVKDLDRHGSSGRGSIVSNSSNLARSIVFRASANGKQAYDPTLFLRFWARRSTSQMGWSCGRVWRFAMVFCARWRRRRCVGRMYASTSRVVVATVLKADKMRINAVLCTVFKCRR